MVVSSHRLLRTLKPKADESFLGYITRLAEHNGYDSPSWVMQMVNINHSIFGSLCPFLSSSSESLSLLANLTGTELSALVQLTYQRVDHWSNDYYSFFGSPIPRYYIRPNPPKICPKCLREAAYCRRVWELNFVTVCPIHKCMLIDICPECGRHITWGRKRLTTCRCGFDWRQSQLVRVKKEHELNLAYLIYRLCGLLDNEDTSHPSHQNPVFKLALPDLIFAVVFITGQLQGLSILGNHRLPRWRNKELHWRITGAYYLLENWPNNFYEFLDWWRIQQRKFSPTFLRVKSVLHRDFGNFYAGLYKILLGSEYDFIRDAFVNYLAEEWEGCEIPTFSQNPPTTKYISKTDAKRLLDLDEPSIAYLIEIGRLRTIGLRKGKRGLIFVDVSDIAKLSREAF